MKKYTVKLIYKKFLEITEKYELLDLDICGVKIWQYSQYEIFNIVLNKLNVLDKNQHINMNKYQIIKNIPSVIYNMLFMSPQNCREEKEILVFNHPRKTFIDGNYIDIYTQYYLDELEKKTYCIMEKPYMMSHKSKKVYNIKYLDDLKVKSKIKTWIGGSIKLKDEDLEKIIKIQDDLFLEFDIRINLKHIFEKNIKRFKSNYDYYDKLIRKSSPKVIFLVVYYSYMELIHAAKRNGIPVVEIQHGIITPYSICYNFPRRKKELEYFPNKILVFGDFWKDSIEWPINKDNLISTGFPFLRKQVLKFTNEQKDPNQVLFISQGAIGKKLFEIVINLAKRLPDYKFIYKLHPGEYTNWKYRYGYNKSISELKNLNIVDTNEKELYSYFATSKFVVGVYSTAMYEALAFNCECMLVNLSGIEFMEKLINIGGAYVVEDFQDLERIIINNNKKDEKHNYFFETNCSTSIIKDIVDNIK